MKATLLLLALLALPAAATAQTGGAPATANAARAAGAEAKRFVTVAQEPRGIAWWLRAKFRPFHTEVRGIPVAKISRGWCKATEFRKELLPDGLIVENGKDTMAANKLAFAVEGSFDRSRTRQTALVGVYETCQGRKGTFLLILDPPRDGARKIRFLDQTPGEHQFAALRTLPDSSLLMMFCMECDNAARLTWSRSKRRFEWARDAHH